MCDDTSALLLTGATGLVGSALINILVRGRPRRFLLLSRKTGNLDNVVANSRPLHGDITHPRLGLDDQTYDDLKHSVTEIIHCAADTRFGTALESARTVNTAGTQEVLNLASQCTRLRKFAFISTVYVAGRSAGYFPERSIRHHNGFFNPYQQSKYEAEQLVSQAMDNLPAAVFRLSSIIGHSTTGVVTQFNHVHRLLRLFPQNVLPLAPGRPDAPIDLIAGDWAMAALAYLFESAFQTGRFYQICAGPANSLTVREMIDRTISVFENHPDARKWLPIRVPELVSLSRYEKFIDQRSRDNDRIFNELVRVLGYFLPHLALFQAFDNTDTLRALAPSGLQLPVIGDCFEKVVKFCLDTNWGRSNLSIA
jgi:nucleoside-diphosphate-sugar epimerase